MDRAEYIHDQLQHEILSGRIDSSTLLDEYSLIKRFGGPRSAIRSALILMAKAGLVTRERRIGTVPQSPDARFTSAPAAVFRAADAATPRMVTLSLERLPAPAEIAADLQLAVGADVTLLERSAVSHGRPTTYWRIWTPLDVQSAFPSRVPEDRTWYELAAMITGWNEFRVSRQMMGGKATEPDAADLGVELGAPISFSTRLTTTADGTPVDRSFGRIDTTRLVNSDVFTIRI